MNIKPHCLAVAVIALASASHLSAQTGTSSLNSISPARSVNGMFGGINTRSVNSGVMQDADFEAFCIDPFQGIVFNTPITYDASPTFSTPDVAKAISKLVGGYYNSGQTAQEAAATASLMPRSCS